MSTVRQSAGPRPLDVANAPAKSGPEDPAVAKAARQFEAVFLQQMLKAMRSTVPDSGLFPKGSESPMYDHLMDQSVAEHMTAGPGVGIADFLYRKWTGNQLPGAQVRIAGAVSSAIPGSGGGPLTDPIAPFVPSTHPTIDDGTRPLRDMLPPTGLEGDFSLNHPAQGHDRPQREQIPFRGSNNERENHTTTDNDGEAASGGDTITRPASGSAERRRASAAYAEHAATLRGGHPRNAGTGGNYSG